MGAWIETLLPDVDLCGCFVAPCVGAWIETFDQTTVIEGKNVAPCVGAWIETKSVASYKNIPEGRTLRGCVD